MLFKFNERRRHKIPKARYRVAKVKQLIGGKSPCVS
jgi:hypothetical protein